MTQELEMSENNLERQIIVLFDEQGTPTFESDRETDYFLGVAVTYELAKEENILGMCNGLFGLSNQKPLKNNRISNSRAERISNLVAKLPIQIVVKSVNLADSEFQQTMTIYVQLFNELRKKLRCLEESNLAQRLYSHVLVETVFNSIQSYLERHLTSSCISVYVDQHCFPKDDIKIHLKDWARSIEHDVNSLYEKLGPELRVRTDPISLMMQDSPRKWFVDVITSVVSRFFFREESKRFSKEPLQTLLKNNVNRYEDITQASMDFIRRLMDDISRNPPIGLSMH